MYRYARSLLTACFAASLPALANADVTVTQQLTTNGFGPMGLGAMNGTTVAAISGSRARIESNLHFKSRFLRVLARHAGESAQIIHLDEDRVDELNERDKSYREMTFGEYRAVMAKATEDVQAAQRQQPMSMSGIDESQCEWLPPKSSVKRTGERASIAGLEGEHVAVSLVQTCADKKTSQRCDFTFVIDEWLAPDVPGQREQREFWMAYAKKLDLSGEVTSLQARGAQMIFSRYKDAWKETLGKAAALKGYPLKTAISVQVGGPSCNNSSQSPADTRTAANPAAALIGLFGKIHKSHDSAPTDPPAAPGMVELFRMTTETVSIASTPVPPERLQVPPGFRKIEKGS
jgi:hypothetical protein